MNAAKAEIADLTRRLDAALAEIAMLTELLHAQATREDNLRAALDSGESKPLKESSHDR